jgi:hypothetical protein
MRMKWHRDGVHDFGYNQMLKQVGLGTWTMFRRTTQPTDYAITPSSIKPVTVHGTTNIDMTLPLTLPWPHVVALVNTRPTLASSTNPSCYWPPSHLLLTPFQV